MPRGVNQWEGGLATVVFLVAVASLSFGNVLLKLEFGTLVGAYTGDRIHWRGRRYRLLPDGTLSPCPQSS